MNPDAKLLYVSPEEIRPIQLARLKETLERAKRAPYFAERLKNCQVNSLDDLAKLPLTTKEDLQAASPFGDCRTAHELFQYTRVVRHDRHSVR